MTSQRPHLEGPVWRVDLGYLELLLRRRNQRVEDILASLPPMRRDKVLGGSFYMKNTAARFITHGSMANSCTQSINTEMPSPELCARTVHRGYRHTGIDFTSQYEQIPVSAITSLVHTIGFDCKEYSPYLPPKAHTMPLSPHNA